MIYNLIHFDPIDTAQLQSEYRAHIQFHGREILLDLNFTKKTIDPSALDAIALQINRLHEIDAENRVEIEAEAKEGFVVRDYIDDAMDMLEKDDIKLILKNADPSKPKKQQWFDALYLNRVGFYPEETEQCIISDYTYSEDLIDDVLVVARKLDGSFTSIQVEN